MSTSKKLPTGTKKLCFIITPIGSSNDETRKRVDQWEDLIYRPAIGEDYEIIRADKYQVPGVITEQIVQLIADADLVIIDYTGLNSNVMYEAAIRHLAEKPCIQIYQDGEKLPFDIQNLRAISYDPKDLDYPKKLINNIQTSLKAVSAPHYEPPSLVKEKYNFDRIVSDPEKFVSILRKHIFASNTATDTDENIVTIVDYINTQNSYLGNRKIVCPKCGTIKYENYLRTVQSYTVQSCLDKHYKCKNCGTEFQA